MEIFQSVISGIIGVVLGIILKYVFDLRIIQNQKMKEQESKAYVDYMKAVALSAKAHLLKAPSAKTDATIAIIDAKSRICVYGHDEVAKALSEFEKSGATIGDEEQTNAYINLVKKMRQRSCNYKALSSEIIEWNLLKKPNLQ